MRSKSAWPGSGSWPLCVICAALEEAVRAAESALRALEMPEGTVTVADLVWLGDQASAPF